MKKINIILGLLVAVFLLAGYNARTGQNNQSWSGNKYDRPCFHLGSVS